MPHPWKVFYIDQMFRYERPQSGRLREHTQFGSEIIGSEDPWTDVEVIALAHRFLDEWSRGFVLKLNSIGDEHCRPKYREALVEFLSARSTELCDEHRTRFLDNPLRVLDCKRPKCRETTANAPRITEYLDSECEAHFKAVRKGLEQDGISFEVDARVVRGLDYYTRTTFEFLSSTAGRAQDTLCGGGRYDGLAVVLGGKPTPGVGFGLGIERLLEELDDSRRYAVSTQWRPSVYVSFRSEEMIPIARALRWELHENGIRTDLPIGTSLKGQMRAADTFGAEFVVIVELAADGRPQYTLRHMESGTQRQLSRQMVIDELSQRFGSKAAGERTPR